jgi:hypothetical protein
MAKAKGTGFLSGMTPVRITVEQTVVAKMTDVDDIQGVAWSPKYRAWRAYKHVGRVQVHHSLHETKSAAIDARKEADRKFGKSPSKEQIKEWIPAAAFRRVHRAPKVAVRKRAVLRCRSVMTSLNRLVVSVSRKWPEDEGARRKSPMEHGDKVRLARGIGQILALAEYLRMTGDLRIEDIEDGMTGEVQELVKYKI